MKIRDATLGKSPWLIPGLALFVAYAGSVVLSVTWVPALIGPSVAIAAATEAISGTAQHRVEADNVELAMLLDWHVNASSGSRLVLNALSCSLPPTFAALPAVHSDKRL